MRRRFLWSTQHSRCQS